MAKHITQWTPDTHPDVTIEYEWDDSVPEDERVHTFKQFVREPKHQRFTGALEDKYQKVIAENMRKNNALSELVTLYPENKKIRQLQPDGTEIVQFSKQPKWRIDDNGEVEFDLDDEPVLKASLRNKIKTIGARIKR